MKGARDEICGWETVKGDELEPAPRMSRLAYPRSLFVNCGSFLRADAPSRCTGTFL